MWSEVIQNLPMSCLLVFQRDHKNSSVTYIDMARGDNGKSLFGLVGVGIAGSGNSGSGSITKTGSFTTGGSHSVGNTSGISLVPVPENHGANSLAYFVQLVNKNTLKFANHVDSLEELQQLIGVLSVAIATINANVNST
jgi:hypothetical protein